MKWTTEKPTEPGQYWVKVNKRGYRYSTVCDLDYLITWLDTSPDEVVEWAGPIPMPEGA